MPLTTRHRDGRRIDSTDDKQWTEVHVAGYPHLLCPGCDHGMHGVDDLRRVRHFAHNPNSPADCPVANSVESPEHEHVKRLVALAVRDLGWTAEPEFGYPGRRRIVDVLAISPHDGRRIAFEVQFSAIHKSDAEKRVRLDEENGAQTLWLDAKGRFSLRDLRRAPLRYWPDRQFVDVERLNPLGGWESRRVPLARFVQDACRGSLIYVEGRWATPADLAALEARLAEQREVALKRRRQVEEEARREAAVVWPQRTALAVDAAQELMARHRRRAEAIRGRAAMVWPQRLQAAWRQRERDEQRRRDAARRALWESEQEELERARAAWRADRDRYCVGLGDDTDEEVLARCDRFAEEYRERVAAHTARAWGRIGDLLHRECLRRDITHS